VFNNENYSTGGTNRWSVQNLRGTNLDWEVENEHIVGTAPGSTNGLIRWEKKGEEAENGWPNESLRCPEHRSRQNAPVRGGKKNHQPKLPTPTRENAGLVGTRTCERETKELEERNPEKCLLTGQGKVVPIGDKRAKAGLSYRGRRAPRQNGKEWLTTINWWGSLALDGNRL